MKTLEQLQAELVDAIAECDRSEIPAHMVRNCPSALQRRDQAWRRRRNLEYQIRQLENNEKIY
jgi:hypothetical protein